jgi:hypothetical protein
MGESVAAGMEYDSYVLPSCGATRLSVSPKLTYVAWSMLAKVEARREGLGEVVGFGVGREAEFIGT